VGRYTKGVEGVDHHYQPEDGGLFVTVPEDDISRSIGEILDELVIGATSQQTEFIRENLLDLDEFPYLTDALDWVAEVWHRFRQGDADLTICVNNGPDRISLEDTPREHMCSCIWRDGSYNYMLLDLVFEPGDMTLIGMLGDRKRELLQWMKGLVALYKLDTDESVEKHLRKRDDLAEAKEQLFFHNLAAPGARGKLEITQQGRRAIGRVLDERDELIDGYDIYRDVVLRHRRDGTVVAEFATLSGADYRVAVFAHEGIDPFRAVFLLSLLSGDLDAELAGKKWLDAINSDRFYEKLLAPVVDRASLEPQELDALVAQGKQYLSRTSAQRERASYSRQVLERAKTIQAFPRPPASAKTSPGEGEHEREGAFVRASESARPDELGDPPSAATRASADDGTDAAEPVRAHPGAAPAVPGFPPPPAPGRRTRGFRGSAPPNPAPGPLPGRGPGVGPAPRPPRRAFGGSQRPPGSTPNDDDGWL
jgi:hypothetical protein